VTKPLPGNTETDATTEEAEVTEDSEELIEPMEDAEADDADDGAPEATVKAARRINWLRVLAYGVLPGLALLLALAAGFLKWQGSVGQGCRRRPRRGDPGGAGCHGRPADHWSGNKSGDDRGRLAQRCTADIPDGLVKSRGRKPLNELRQNSASGLLHGNDHSHGAAGNFTGNEGAGNHPPSSGCEVNRVRQYDYIQFMVTVAARCDVPGGDHRPAARFTW
jgi:hypothetical protein